MGYKWVNKIKDIDPEIKLGKWKGWGRYSRRVSQQSYKDLKWLLESSKYANNVIKKACRIELNKRDNASRMDIGASVRKEIAAGFRHREFRKLLIPMPEWGLE